MSKIGLQTLFNREITRIMRIWPQTLLPPVITMSLYFMIFGTFIGSQIDNIQGVNYITFILPGLIMMSVVSNSYLNVVSSLFGCKFQNNIEEMLVSPLSTLTILLGFISGGLFRGLTVGLCVSIVGLLFTKVAIYNLAIVISVVVLTSLLFSLGGVINALYAKTFDDISIIPTFVITPLTYLGGVFYSIDLLPPIWKTISLFNPILYIINTFRYGFIGISDINITTALITIVGFIILLFYLCYILLDKGIGIKN